MLLCLGPEEARFKSHLAAETFMSMNQYCNSQSARCVPLRCSDASPSPMAMEQLAWLSSNDRLPASSSWRLDLDLHTNSHRLMLYLMHQGRPIMRPTINIDDDLLAKVTKLTGPLDRSSMVREGLQALIERESAKRLAKLGGSQPKLKPAPRRRQETGS